MIKIIISVILLYTEAQDRLNGTLVVDVDAKTDVDVFWFIFNGDNNIVINFTVSVINYYITILCGLYLEVQ